METKIESDKQKSLIFHDLDIKNVQMSKSDPLKFHDIPESPWPLGTLYIYTLITFVVFHHYYDNDNSL